MSRMSLLVCLLAAATVGCGRTHDSGPVAGATADALRPPSLADVARTPAAAVAPKNDAGLVAYTGRSRKEGHYVWHQVGISEADALSAAASGMLSVKAPSGEVLRFRHERVVEHPGGEWTWIGRLENGTEADQTVLSFGEGVVTGSIARKGQPPLKLALHDGATWLIEPDAVALAAQGGAKLRRSPDFKIPSERAEPSPDARMRMAASAQAAASASDYKFIDVVLGYTPGFKDGRITGACEESYGVAGCERMRQFAARLQLLYFADIANIAYQNSGLKTRIRVVAIVPVDYTDANSNDRALDELTGKVATPAALQKLRQARETYGADLVTLVRQLKVPQSGSCGVAWLIGANRTAITNADSDLGYSMVNSGQDVDETDGGTYVCDDETLAHELGHNMGLQHDRDNARASNGQLAYGAYSYAFGHQVDTYADSFYTIMAYGDGWQTPYRIFSKPGATLCGGAACGVAGVADNARALTHTMPLVAKFRASKTPDPWPVRNDLDGDGISDIVFGHPNGNDPAVWFMDGYSKRTPKSVLTSGARHPVLVTDTDHNGLYEIIATDYARKLHRWHWDGSSFSREYSFSTFGAGYSLVAATDMDGDRKPEMIFHNPTTQQVSMWFLADFERKSSVSATLPPGSVLGASGDFDGDGLDEVLWTTPSREFRFMRWDGGIEFVASAPNYYAAGYVVAGAADVNGDGTSEVILHNAATGQFSVWMLDANLKRKASKSQSVPIGYVLSSHGDFSGRGREDLLWTDSARHMLYTIWADQTKTSTLTYAAGYRVVD